MSVDLTSLRIDPSMKQPAARPARPRWPIWAGIAAVIAIALLLWVHNRPAAVEVEVARAVLAPSGAAGAGDTVVLNAAGYIVAAHKIELAAKVIGRVSWVGVEMGDKVKKGQPLVRLEDDEYRARLLQEQGQFEAAKARLAQLAAGSRPQEIERAKADLDEATAEMQNAKVSVDRDRELANTKAISQQTIDDAEAKFDGAVAKLNSLKQTYELAKVGPRQEEIDAQRGQVEQMQGMLDLAKVDLANTVIYAPTDGTILERNVEVGEFVTTGFVGDRGAKGYVVSLADLNDLRVELDIAQSDFRNVSVGQKCSVTTDAYPDRKYEGKVDLVAPQANRQKATVLAKVKILNPDDLLRPEMNASVAFFSAGVGSSTSQAPGVLISVSAIHGHTVFVVENGKAVERTVEIGATTSKGVYVRGIREGESVIVSPPESLQAGQSVK